MVKDEEHSGNDFRVWTMPKPCDVCKIKSSLLYCKADSAYLCVNCDVKVHGANKLASRHERVWMCEVCEQAPAVVTCKADAAVLCRICDADIHSANPLARRHERVPLASFFECARLLKPLPPLVSVVVTSMNNGGFDGESLEDNDDDDLAASWLLPNPKQGADGLKVSLDGDEIKGGGGGGGGGGACFVPSGELDFFPEVDPYLDLEHASSMDTAATVSCGTDSVVPVQSHGHGSSSSSDGFDADPPSSKGGYSYTSAASLSHSVSSSSLDGGVVPEATLAEISTPYGQGLGGVFELAGHAGVHVAVSYGVHRDREAKVMRYKEKRKNRKFEKTIRYASRKAYAETRPRVKGRFAKRTDAVDVDQVYTSADLGYGLVPSF